jgi:trehalose-phosphatase
MEEPDLSSLASFWPEFKKTASKILILDYDGTLAPFKADRNKAFPYPGVREILKKIRDSSQTRLIIVSGRNVEDITVMLDMQGPPEIWGGHGFERKLPGADIKRKKIPASCSAKLEKAFTWVRDHGYETNCEHKGSSLAFHWRGLTGEASTILKEKVNRAWSPLTEEGELAVHPFDGGLELRCKGMHKGDAVRQILKESTENSVVAYLGDDFTDEDAFRALKGKGLTVLVRNEYRETLADHWLKPPDDLLPFLQNWYKYSVK